MTARTYTAAEVQDIARRAWEACQQACENAVPDGWTGLPHQSNMDFGPNVAGRAKRAIRALPTPDMGDIINGGEDD